MGDDAEDGLGAMPPTSSLTPNDWGGLCVINKNTAIADWECLERVEIRQRQMSALISNQFSNIFIPKLCFFFALVSDAVSRHTEAPVPSH